MSHVERVQCTPKPRFCLLRAPPLINLAAFGANLGAHTTSCAIAHAGHHGAGHQGKEMVLCTEAQNAKVS